MTRRAKEQRQKRLEQKRAADTPEEAERRLKWALLLKTLDAPARPPPAGKFELPIRVEEAGSDLSYTFETKDMDIDFSITFEGLTSVEYLVHPTRCASHESTVRGSLDIPGPGTVVLVWDNEYSWFNAKELSYHVGLKTPEPDVSTAKTPVSLLDVELDSRKQQYRTLNESYDMLQLQCTKRATSIQVIERQIEELQRELHEEKDLHAVESAEAERVGRQIDSVAAELAALSWRTLSPPLFAHVLAYCSREDWKRWYTLNKAWTTALTPLLAERAIE